MILPDRGVARRAGGHQERPREVVRGEARIDPDGGELHEDRRGQARGRHTKQNGGAEVERPPAHDSHPDQRRTNGASDCPRAEERSGRCTERRRDASGAEVDRGTVGARGTAPGGILRSDAGVVEDLAVTDEDDHILRRAAAASHIHRVDGPDWIFSSCFSVC